MRSGIARPLLGVFLAFGLSSWCDAQHQKPGRYEAEITVKVRLDHLLYVPDAVWASSRPIKRGRANQRQILYPIENRKPSLTPAKPPEKTASSVQSHSLMFCALLNPC